MRSNEPRGTLSPGALCVVVKRTPTVNCSFTFPFLVLLISSLMSISAFRSTDLRRKSRARGAGVWTSDVSRWFVHDHHSPAPTLSVFAFQGRAGSAFPTVSVRSPRQILSQTVQRMIFFFADRMLFFQESLRYPLGYSADVGRERRKLRAGPSSDLVSRSTL